MILKWAVDNSSNNHPFSGSFSSERGITLILFALLITFCAMILSLVVDLGRQELALTQLRQAADAAALSGARKLNGRPDGWRAAKLAAVLVLRQYPIHGVPADPQGDLRLATGPTSHWDKYPISGYHVAPPTVQKGTIGDSSNFHVQLERGIVRAKVDRPEELEFLSLEEAAEGSTMAGESYLFANSVRVSLRMDFLPGMFSRIFQTLGFYNLQVKAVAAMDGNLERLVAPIAVAFEDIMLDTSPETYSRNHHLPWYLPEAEYGREVEVGVLNKLGRSNSLGANVHLDHDPLGQVSPRNFVNEGITRSRSFIRPPYTLYDPTPKNPPYPSDVCYGGAWKGPGPNCKAVPVEAFFALPRVQSVNAEQIVSALENGGVRARVGDVVEGLSSLGDLARDESLSQRLANFINESPLTFSQFFIESNGTPKQNYPFLRTTRKDLHNPAQNDQAQDPQYRPEYSGTSALQLGFLSEYFDLFLAYPMGLTPTGLFARRQRFIMGDMSAQAPGDPPQQEAISGAGQLNFVNPMCHFAQIPLNNPSQNRVREVYAMVVAPQKATSESGKKVQYRDFEAMFSGQTQSAISEVRETLPTVVGFVKIGIFDGNTLALNLKFPVNPLSETANPDATWRTSTPFYGSQALNNYVVDNNPAWLDMNSPVYRKDIKNFFGKVEDSYECFDASTPETRDKCEIPETPSLFDELQGLFQCFDLRFLKNELTGTTFGNVRKCCMATAKECGFESSSSCTGCSVGKGCCDRLCFGEGKRREVSDFLALLDYYFQKPIKANPDTHCLLTLKANADKAGEALSYEPLHPLSAGFGCAGLRGRLALIERPRSDDPAEDPISFVSTIPWSRQSPALVEVTD